MAAGGAGGTALLYLLKHTVLQELIYQHSIHFVFIVHKT